MGDDRDMILCGFVLFAVMWHVVFLWFIFTGRISLVWGFFACLFVTMIPVLYVEWKECMK